MDELFIDDLVFAYEVDPNGLINVYSAENNNYIDKEDAKLIIAHLKELFDI